MPGCLRPASICSPPTWSPGGGCRGGNRRARVHLCRRRGAQTAAGFVPVRKKGKLPYKTHEQTYDLEYGTNTIAIHIDAVKPGSRVLLIDDLLATGGTAEAAAALMEQMGVKIVEMSFFIELGFLKGRERLKGCPYGRSWFTKTVRWTACTRWMLRCFDLSTRR